VPNHAKRDLTTNSGAFTQSEKIGKEDERKEAQEEIPRHVGIGNEDYAQGGSEDRALKA
jgi:hypothetical protein